jgi:hypothetical protein
MSDAASFASRPGKLWLGGKGTSGDGRAKRLSAGPGKTSSRRRRAGVEVGVTCGEIS